MRIGSLTSLAFQKYDRTEDRDVVSKHVPGYVQTFQYDLVSTNPTIQIEGTLIGTSNANLASQIATLKAMHRNKRVVWIDASDQYQGLIDFCRIIKLQGPTVDSSRGPLIATFSLEAVSLLPWGTTQFNPASMSGIILRDLSGVGREEQLNPLVMNCNYTFSSSQQSDQGGNASNWFSWEFIVDNQNPFTEATSTQEANCDSLGTGTASVTNPIAGSSLNQPFTFAIDNTNFKEGTGSLKMTKSSPAASTNYNGGYNFGTTGLNLSSYDRTRMWIRCDQANQLLYAILIVDTSGNWRQYSFSLQGANTWMNLEVKNSAFTNQSGTPPSMSAIQYIQMQVQTAASPPASINVWIDDIRAEVGLINHGGDTSFTTTKNGTGVTFSNDSVIYKISPYPTSAQNPLGITPTAETSAPAALKMAGTSDASGNLGLVYTLQPQAWDLTSPTNYDFLLLWVRSDFGGNATGTIQVMLGTTLWTAFFQWNYANLNANQCYRLVIPLQNPSSKTGSPNLNSILAVQVNSVGKASHASNLWVDEISADMGAWVNLEFQIPDNVSQTSTSIQTNSWNGSSYAQIFQEDPFGSTIGGSNCYALDGSAYSAIYNDPNQNKSQSIFAIGPIGTIPHETFGNAPAVTYSTAYGCNERLSLSLKIPPATSDSIAAGYPSDDLSGFQAFNKVRLLIKIFYTNEDTNYIGF